MKKNFIAAKTNQKGPEAKGILSGVERVNKEA
jgi:hypothetical protein